MEKHLPVFSKWQSSVSVYLSNSRIGMFSKKDDPIEVYQPKFIGLEWSLQQLFHDHFQNVESTASIRLPIQSERIFSKTFNHG